MSINREKLDKVSTIIQSELMDDEVFERILSEVVSADELTPDPSNKAKEQPKAANTTAKTTKQKQAVVTSKITTESKKGFDLIAGFYTNKSTANQMCSRLKGHGCDAYIINRNGLYYVSMGSAASKTEADAMFKHIKSWYKEDVSIKKW